MVTASLYISCHVGHFNVCVKFELNDMKPLCKILSEDILTTVGSQTI